MNIKIKPFRDRFDVLADKSCVGFLIKDRKRIWSFVPNACPGANDALVNKYSWDESDEVKDRLFTLTVIERMTS